MSSGLFVTFEGGEGAGKTTLIHSVTQYLNAKNIPVIPTREPGGTPFGEKVRSFVLNYPSSMSDLAELSLFLAARAQHVEELILPALQGGKVVLCDRFHDSSVAYQGAARGIGMDQVRAFSEFVSKGLKPHCSFYLDIDPEVGLARAKKVRLQDRIESETLQFHQTIRSAFLTICKQDSHRMHRIDANQSKEEVYAQTIHILDRYLRQSCSSVH